VEVVDWALKGKFLFYILAAPVIYIFLNARIIIDGENLLVFFLIRDK